jgi:hypothetical protein
MWQQSRVISLDGAARQKTPFRYKVEGMGFAMVEVGARYFRWDAAEELMVVEAAPPPN